jgi:penicillin-binding protein 1A
MADNGYITSEQARAAIAEPLVTQTRPLGIQAVDADYFVEETRRILYAKYGQAALYDGGLQVRSTLDTRLQNYAVNALRTGLVRYDRRHGWRGAVSNISTSGDWKDALVSAGNQSGIDTWRVAVVLGFGPDRSIEIGLDDGRNAQIPFTEMQWARKELPGASVGAQPSSPDQVRQSRRCHLCRAGRCRRQLRPAPGAGSERRHRGDGSAHRTRIGAVRRVQLRLQPVRPRDAGRTAAGIVFKPFVYAAALDNGFTPVTKVDDAPVSSLPQGPGLPMWSPKNFEGKFAGPTTLRRGLELSMDAMTVRLAAAAGDGQDHAASDPFRRLRQPAALSVECARCAGYDIDADGDGLFGIRQRRKEDQRDPDRPRIRIAPVSPSIATIPRVCDGCNAATWDDQSEPMLPDTREQVLDPTAFPDRVAAGRRRAARNRRCGQGRRQAAGRQDRHVERSQRRLVHRVFARPHVRRFRRLRQSPHAGTARAGRDGAAPIFRDFMKGALAKTSRRRRSACRRASTSFSVDSHSGALVSASDTSAIQEAFKAGTEPGLADEGPLDATATNANANSGNGKTVDQGTGGLY